MVSFCTFAENFFYEQYSDCHAYPDIADVRPRVVARMEGFPYGAETPAPHRYWPFRAARATSGPRFLPASIRVAPHNNAHWCDARRLLSRRQLV